MFLVSLIFISACTNTDTINNIPQNTEPTENNTQEIDLTTYRRGAKNPTVVLEEYSDFFCPHCANVQPILKLLSRYPWCCKANLLILLKYAGKLFCL